MKLAALLILINFVFTECVNNKSIPTYTAYDYLEKVAIPEANRIRRAEEKLKSKQRIVGGTPADYGQYPYQVGLILSITNLTEVGACGGTLLNENRILTAAHCWFDGVNQVSKVTAILGSVFLFFGGVRSESSFVVTHPRWTPVLARNDIAVIYLPNSISFSTYIAPVALPSDDELNEDFVGAIAIASGFGVTSDYDTTVDTRILNFVHLNVIDNEICEMVFPVVVQPTNICTSDLHGGSTCRGDSGGPLVVERNGRSVLIGVTSFGSIFGCELGLPSVFTRVTSFITFINDNL